MHILLASRIGKWTHAVGAAVGLYYRAALQEVSTRRYPRAVAGEARRLKRMRRDRDRGARTPIIRARTSWIGGSALLLHKSYVGNDRRDERGSTG